MKYGKGTWRNKYKPLQSDLDKLADGEWPENYQPTQEEYNDFHSQQHQNSQDKANGVEAEIETESGAEETESGAVEG